MRLKIFRGQQNFAPIPVFGHTSETICLYKLIYDLANPRQQIKKHLEHVFHLADNFTFANGELTGTYRPSPPIDPTKEPLDDNIGLTVIKNNADGKPIRRIHSSSLTLYLKSVTFLVLLIMPMI